MHGTPACYNAGCRLPECREAKNAYQRRRYLDGLWDRPRTVPALGSMRRLRALAVMGWDAPRLSADSGLDTSGC